MKRSLTLLCLSLLLCFSGCHDKEVKVSTRVFPDGSFKRTVVVKADSSDIYSDDLPVPIDSTWSTEVRRSQEEGENNKFILTATKRFPDVEALNASTIPESGSSGLLLTSTFGRRFRWFFTYITYEESFGILDFFKAFPISDYLSDTEIVSLNKEDNPEWEGLSPQEKEYWDAVEDTASKKSNEWFTRSIFEKADQTVRPLLQARGISIPSKDSIASDLGRLEEVVDSIAEIYSDYLSTEEIAMLGEDPKVKLLDQQLSYLFDTVFWQEPTDFEIAMPGVILSSNADRIEGNVACWDNIKEDPLSFLQNEGLQVESRVVNWWAFGLSAVVLLLATVSFLVSSIRSGRAT